MSNPDLTKMLERERTKLKRQKEAYETTEGMIRTLEELLKKGK